MYAAINPSLPFSKAYGSSIASQIKEDNSSIIEMITVLKKALERLTTSEVELSTKASTLNTPEESDLCYVRVAITKEYLSEEDESRLGNLGIDCLSDAGPYEIYGVVANSARALARVLNDEVVRAVDLEEPPCCK